MKCPICHGPTDNVVSIPVHERKFVDCPVDGQFYVTETAERRLANFADIEARRAILGRARASARPGAIPVVNPKCVR